MPKHIRKTLETIIRQFTDAHGDKYDYSKVLYLGSNKKVEIVCQNHGPFWQWPNDHRHGAGCPACSKNKPVSSDDFWARMSQMHGNKYKFISDFVSIRSEMRIMCATHGEFTATARQMWHGGGCRQCGYDKMLVTKLRNGTISDPALRDAFEVYRHEVRKLSNQNFIKYYHDINPTGIRRGSEFHLDHIISIADGFINGITIEDISAPSNLRLISSVENQKKGCRRDGNAKSEFDPSNIKTSPLSKSAADMKRLTAMNTYLVTDLSTNTTSTENNINEWCRIRNISPSSVKWAANYQKTPFKGRYIIKKI